MRDADAILPATIGQPGLVLGPLVYATARWADRSRLHRRKLLDIEHFDAGGYFPAGRRALDHEDTHDFPSSYSMTDPRTHDATSPHERVVTVTAPINSSW